MCVSVRERARGRAWLCECVHLEAREEALLQKAPQIHHRVVLERCQQAQKLLYNLIHLRVTVV
jgi:hypothetical protein